jgi:hypothetical protein
MGARLGRGGQEASICDLLGARLRFASRADLELEVLALRHQQKFSVARLYPDSWENFAYHGSAPRSDPPRVRGRFEPRCREDFYGQNSAQFGALLGTLSKSIRQRGHNR